MAHGFYPPFNDNIQTITVLDGVVNGIRYRGPRLRPRWKERRKTRQMRNRWRSIRDEGLATYSRASGRGFQVQEIEHTLSPWVADNDYPGRDARLPDGYGQVLLSNPKDIGNPPEWRGAADWRIDRYGFVIAGLCCFWSAVPDWGVVSHLFNHEFGHVIGLAHRYGNDSWVQPPPPPVFNPPGGVMAYISSIPVPDEHDLDELEMMYLGH